MELHQLAYLVAVVEEGSFTQAAARMRVAQPGISRQIRRLEHELGESLLDRSGPRIRLTSAGDAFLPHARSALGAVSAGRHSIAELRGLLTGRVALGVTANLPVIDLPELLAEFQRRHAAIRISLTETSADPLIEHIRAGELDLGLAGLAGEPPPDLDSRLLATLPLVIATARDDPLAHHAGGPLNLIDGRPLISLPHGSTLRELLEAGCRHAGIRPNISYETSSLQLLLDLTAHGVGITVAPAWAVHAHPDRLHTITLSTPVLEARAYLLWKNSSATSPAARAFLDTALRQLTTNR
ncbi:LysR family transcriptional regulator [Nocardia alni]|uniref:LysR family transcriptional regulator n=1 Tax=Nocardia alni TaxID=2815723 RepID=UPI001C21A65F|nr:LysR substrate-binding domain-containing protein [Nocardia alni]